MIPEDKELIIEGKPENPRVRNHYWLKCPRCSAANSISRKRALIILGVQMELGERQKRQSGLLEWAT